MAKGSKYDGGYGHGGGDFAVVDVKDLEMKLVKYTEDGTYALDIMPYKIKTKNHPRVIAGERDIGDEEVNLTLDVHRSVGPKHRNFICPENFGRKCPICDHLADVNNEYGWKSPEGQAAFKKCGKTPRSFYFVVDPDNKKNGIQLFETSWKNFQKELEEEARAEAKRKGLTIIPFADFPDGCTVEFRVTMEALPNGKYPKFKAFKFIPRKADSYPKDLLDELPGLDELMIIKSYEEIDTAFSGADSGDEEESDTTARGRERDTEEETPRSRRGADEDEVPPSRSRQAAEPEEEEEIPTKCPVKGGTFGIDIDELDECDDCSLRGACSAEYKAKRRRGA
jgi:hypothetical protein